MSTQTQWTPSGVTDTPFYHTLGPIEFRDNAGEWHSFECIYYGGKIAFGGACNTGFLESGWIDCDGGQEGIPDAVCELLADLETYYNDGPQYVSRIVCNDRM